MQQQDTHIHVTLLIRQLKTENIRLQSITPTLSWQSWQKLSKPASSKLRRRTKLKLNYQRWLSHERLQKFGTRQVAEDAKDVTAKIRLRALEWEAAALRTSAAV